MLLGNPLDSDRRRYLFMPRLSAQCQTVEGPGVEGCWHLYLAGFAPRVSSDSLLQECLLLSLLSFGRHVLCSVPLSSLEAPDR